MLNSIRRHPHSEPDDYRCSQCDMPLLRAGSTCPSCEPKAQKQAYTDTASMAQELESSVTNHTLPINEPNNPIDVIYGEPVPEIQHPRHPKPTTPEYYTAIPKPLSLASKAPAILQKLQQRITSLTDELNQWVLGQQDRLDAMSNPNEDWLASPISMKLQWGSWQELVIAMLWIVGGISFLFGTLRLYALDGFQAVILFQFSGLAFLSTSAYRRLQNIEKKLNATAQNSIPSEESAPRNKNTHPAWPQEALEATDELELSKQN